MDSNVQKILTKGFIQCFKRQRIREQFAKVIFQTNFTSLMPCKNNPLINPIVAYYVAIKSHINIQQRMGGIGDYIKDDDGFLIVREE